MYSLMKHFKRFFSCCSRKNFNNTGVYKLKLNNNKYYIGKSKNIKRRIWCHENDNGSYWTKQFHVINRGILITDENNGKFWELEETLENMYLYGINNVRGSMFTKFTLSREDKIKAAQLYCEMYDLCRKCGSDKHYIYNCKQGNIESWVDKFGGELDIHSRKCRKCLKDINDKPHYHKLCEKCFNN
jgi:predicted GIY-YIG superfamily endonuclease